MILLLKMIQNASFPTRVGIFMTKALLWKKLSSFVQMNTALKTLGQNKITSQVTVVSWHSPIDNWIYYCKPFLSAFDLGIIFKWTKNLNTRTENHMKWINKLSPCCTKRDRGVSLRDIYDMDNFQHICFCVLIKSLMSKHQLPDNRMFKSRKSNKRKTIHICMLASNDTRLMWLQVFIKQSKIERKQSFALKKIIHRFKQWTTMEHPNMQNNLMQKKN